MSRSSLMTTSSNDSPDVPFTVIFSPSLLMKCTVTLSDLKTETAHQCTLYSKTIIVFCPADFDFIFSWLDCPLVAKCNNACLQIFNRYCTFIGSQKQMCKRYIACGAHTISFSVSLGEKKVFSFIKLSSTELQPNKGTGSYFCLNRIVTKVHFLPCLM